MQLICHYIIVNFFKDGVILASLADRLDIQQGQCLDQVLEPKLL